MVALKENEAAQSDDQLTVFQKWFTQRNGKNLSTQQKVEIQNHFTQGSDRIRQLRIDIRNKLKKTTSKTRSKSPKPKPKQNPKTQQPSTKAIAIPTPNKDIRFQNMQTKYKIKPIATSGTLQRNRFIQGNLRQKERRVFKNLIKERLKMVQQEIENQKRKQVKKDSHDLVDKLLSKNGMSLMEEDKEQDQDEVIKNKIKKCYLKIERNDQKYLDTIEVYRNRMKEIDMGSKRDCIGNVVKTIENRSTKTPMVGTVSMGSKDLVTLVEETVLYDQDPSKELQLKRQNFFWMNSPVGSSPIMKYKEKHQMPYVVQSIQTLHNPGGTAIKVPNRYESEVLHKKETSVSSQGSTLFSHQKKTQKVTPKNFQKDDMMRIEEPSTAAVNSRIMSDKLGRKIQTAATGCRTKAGESS